VASPRGLFLALGLMTQLLSQSQICEQFGSLFQPPAMDSHVGIALSTLNQLPLNALRHPSEQDTCGWYIWGGELSQDAEFLQPLHVHHLVKHAPQMVPYLGLAPGWRVLLAPGQTDVWYDPTLLSV
jgi:hypothetical protein